MRYKLAILLCAALAMTAACRKRGTGTGGGGWFVGTDGLMANVTQQGLIGPGYDLGSSETLYGIACRYSNEAWVVGAHGTLLYTSDAGAHWSAQELGVGGDLRALATQDAGPVFVAGDGVFLTGVPAPLTGATTWRSLGDGVTRFRYLAAAQRGETVLAIDDAGGLWSYENDQLVRRTAIEGARAVAVSPDGETVIVAGAGLSRSLDGGKTFAPLAVDAGARFADVRIDDDGEALAVGAAGMVARIDGEGRVLTQRVGTADLKTLHVGSPDDDSGNYSGTGYTAGEGGQVWRTDDFGWSWKQGPNLGRTVLGIDEIGDGHR